jgi:hypothetical protein
MRTPEEYKPAMDQPPSQFSLFSINPLPGFQHNDPFVFLKKKTGYRSACDAYGSSPSHNA